MLPEPFRIEVSDEVAWTVVAVHGEIDIAAGDALRASINGAVAESPAVLVDLAECTFMDSTGVDALVGGHRRATERGGRFAVVVDPASEPARILALTVPGVLEQYASRDHALQ